MNALLLAVSLAAALAVPALAQTAAPSASAPESDSMSADSAVAAVDTASKEAVRGSRDIDNVPVELARATIMVPYGAETLPPEPGPDHLARIVAAKRAYWTRVQAALAAELAKTPDDEPLDEAVSYVGPNAARKMALSHHLIDCERILADIEADAKVDASTPGQSIIARKKALFQEIATKRARVTDDGRGPCP